MNVSPNEQSGSDLPAKKKVIIGKRNSLLVDTPIEMVRKDTILVERADPDLVNAYLKSSGSHSSVANLIDDVYKLPHHQDVSDDTLNQRKEEAAKLAAEEQKRSTDAEQDGYSLRRWQSDTVEIIDPLKMEVTIPNLYIDIKSPGLKHLKSSLSYHYLVLTKKIHLAVDRFITDSAILNGESEDHLVVIPTPILADGANQLLVETISQITMRAFEKAVLINETIDFGGAVTHNLEDGCQETYIVYRRSASNNKLIIHIPSIGRPVTHSWNGEKGIPDIMAQFNESDSLTKERLGGCDANGLVSDIITGESRIGREVLTPDSTVDQDLDKDRATEFVPEISNILEHYKKGLDMRANISAELHSTANVSPGVVGSIRVIDAADIAVLISRHVALGLSSGASGSPLYNAQLEMDEYANPTAGLILRVIYSLRELPAVFEFDNMLSSVYGTMKAYQTPVGLRYAEAGEAPSTPFGLDGEYYDRDVFARIKRSAFSATLMRMVELESSIDKLGEILQTKTLSNGKLVYPKLYSHRMGSRRLRIDNTPLKEVLRTLVSLHFMYEYKSSQGLLVVPSANASIAYPQISSF